MKNLISNIKIDYDVNGDIIDISYKFVGQNEDEGWSSRTAFKWGTETRDYLERIEDAIYNDVEDYYLGSEV